MLQDRRANSSPASCLRYNYQLNECAIEEALRHHRKANCSGAFHTDVGMACLDSAAHSGATRRVERHHGRKIGECRSAHKNSHCVHFAGRSETVNALNRVRVPPSRPCVSLAVRVRNGLAHTQRWRVA